VSKQCERASSLQGKCAWHAGPAAGGEPRRVDLQPPAKVFHVKPEYPELARITRVHGTVVLDCTIDPAGNVVDIRVISGHPLLAPAAVEAVGRWRYSPTRLNGQPVSVLLTVTVRFDLAGPVTTPLRQHWS